MPEMETMMDMIAERLDSEDGEVWYPSVDITFA